MTTTLERHHPPTHKLRAFALLAAFALLLLVPSVRAQGVEGISVAGSGVAYGEPNQATLTVGVIAVGPNVREAIAQADSTMEAIRAVALSHGLTTRDIRTASFNVWREELRDKDNNVTGERYHVSHSYQLTVRNADQVGELLAAAVDAGANDVGGISYSIADPDELRRAARTSAMDDAQQRAQQLAELAHVQLGAPTAIVEISGGAAPNLQPQYDVRAASMASPVEGGELAVHVEVRVTYAISTGTESD